MNKVLDLFTPNFSNKVIGWLIGSQLAFAILLWIFSPFVFLPKPTEVFASLSDLWSAGLGGELITSLYLNIEAVSIAAMLSLLLAYSSCIDFMKPVVTGVGKLRFLSLTGLTFFFTLMTSSGHQLKLALLVFSVVIFNLVGMVDVISSVPSEQIDLARTLRMGNWRTLSEVVVLGQADKMLDVLRLNAAIGWMMLTMVETMSREGGGIGTWLTDQNHHFHLAAVMAIQLVILTCGLGQDYFIGLMKKMFCPYAFVGAK